MEGTGVLCSHGCVYSFVCLRSSVQKITFLFLDLSLALFLEASKSCKANLSARVAIWRTLNRIFMLSYISYYFPVSLVPFINLMCHAIACISGCQSSQFPTNDLFDSQPVDANRTKVEKNPDKRLYYKDGESMPVMCKIPVLFEVKGHAKCQNGSWQNNAYCLRTGSSLV